MNEMNFKELIESENEALHPYSTGAARESVDRAYGYSLVEFREQR